jgi:hypothetical protein
MDNKIKMAFCQKVLPLVYDESLSYYEVLCKLTDKMNEVIDFMSDNISEVGYKLVNEFLKKMFANALYTKETENLTLSFETIVSDSYHVYTDSDETMEIKDKVNDNG